MSGLRESAQAVVDVWDDRDGRWDGKAFYDALDALRDALARDPWEPYVPAGGISAANPLIGIQPSEYPLWCRTCHRPKEAQA